MMALTSSVLAVLLATSPFQGDNESKEARAMRLEIIAKSIVHAVDRATCTQTPKDCRRSWGGARRELAAALLTVGWFESHWAEYVGAGRCLTGRFRCDLDRKGNPRARSYWQIWRVSVLPNTDWDKMAGVNFEATSIAAWHAARHFGSGRRFCTGKRSDGDEVAAWFAGYRASDCNWAEATQRATKYRSILARL